jgi:hypothetical protein
VRRLRGRRGGVEQPFVVIEIADISIDVYSI